MSVEDAKDLYEEQRQILLDPTDPEVIAGARAEGISDEWIEAAQRSPVYALINAYRVALPLHPEFRVQCADRIPVPALHRVPQQGCRRQLRIGGVAPAAARVVRSPFTILGVTEADELRPGHVKMWMLSSSFHTDDEAAAAFSVQRGRRRQAVMGRTDLVGDEPRLLIDFNKGAPLFSVGGQPVGERRKDRVSLFGEQYRLRRRGFRPLGLRFDARWDDRLVLRVRQRSRPNTTVRIFTTYSAADLDPIVTLGLIVVEARPDRMSILGELTGGESFGPASERSVEFTGHRCPSGGGALSAKVFGPQRNRPSTRDSYGGDSYTPPMTYGISGGNHDFGR